jgi:hypothetical protein
VRIIDGKPVSDAEDSVVIHITQADCERGSKKDPTKCAAAVALKRTTGCDECQVHMAFTYLLFGKKWVRYATPVSLRAEIISFDRGGGFYPGDFRLHPPAPSLRLKTIPQKPGPKPKATAPAAPIAPAGPRAVNGKVTGAIQAEAARGAKTKPDRLLMRLQQNHRLVDTGLRRKLPAGQRTAKAEPRVFHRVKGVRERANAKAE